MKLYLIKERYSDVMNTIRKSHVWSVDFSIFNRERVSQVALYFVKDEKTRFNLALECGDIQVATESAKAVDELKCGQTWSCCLAAR